MTLRIAACQMRMGSDDLDAALDRVRESADRYGAELVCFPESYPLRPARGSWEPYLERVRAVADRLGVGVLLGATARSADGMKNSAVYIDAEKTAVHDKAHLFANERVENVSEDFRPLIPFRGYEIGVGICYDLLFPEYSRLLTLKGADLLVFMSGMVPKRLAGTWRDVALTRCFENHIPVVSVSAVGEDAVGQSIIATPPNQVLAECAPEEESILFAEIDPKRFKGTHFANSPNDRGSQLFKRGEFGPYMGDLRRDLELERRELLDRLWKSMKGT